MSKSATAGAAALRNFHMSKLLTGAALVALTVPGAALAQDDAETDAQDNEIIVSGIRAVVQDSIATKKNDDLIVDALSSDEIGDLPALSIGEALETLTGAASHREQGGATEIAVRGLGPFLGSTVVNGREASNGSGDRSVNFSQFPSELFNKVAIYKTQSASLIEGGVSGQIALETVRPLDYGKQRFQADLKLNYNPQNFDIGSEYRARDFGYRGTVSFVDQFQIGEAELGISIGYSRNVTTNPEQEARSSSGYRDCRLDITRPGVGVADDNNCDGGSGDLVLEVDPDTGVAPDANTPFVLTSSSRSYRQNITDDDRDSVFAAVQFKPSPDVDINADFQYSDRDFTEIRNDLVFAENRRIDASDVDPDTRLPFDLIVGDNGELIQFTNEQRIETNSQYQERLEEYYGGGLSIAFQVSDPLRISFDGSYSKTSRRENILQTRLQSEDDDIFGDEIPGTSNSQDRDGDGTSDRVETATLIGLNGSDIYNFVVQNFDVNNGDFYADNARTRVDLNQFRNNDIFALRTDFEYALGGNFLTDIVGGVRYSELGYDAVPRVRAEGTYSDASIQQASLACRNASFPESDFLSSVSGGNPLITNVDDNGNVIDAGTGNTYATFDPFCLVQELQGQDPDDDIVLDSNGRPIFPTPGVNVSNVDVTEKTWAGYLQANFDGDWGAVPVRGNFGVRVVHTKVNSIGLRADLNVINNPDDSVSLEQDTGTLVEVVGGGSYTKFLPSFNVTGEVAPDVLVRGAVYRALSRPDPSDLGFGRTFAVDSDDEFATVEEALGLVTALGNPFTAPLMSWNFDAAVEYYPDADSIFAVGFYYKNFDGGFENTTQDEIFTVEGVDVSAPVTTTNVTGDSSTIWGIEVTAAHRFSYLPQPLDGLGFKLSYNYANSDFEFEDGQFGASSVIGSNGQVIERVGIVAPANLPGLSKHVFSGQLYYQIGNLDLQGVYKYRSRYFQQFISTPNNIRYVGNTGVFEARLSYKITPNIRFTLEGINLFNEPRRQFNPTVDNIAEVNVYGPRYFAGVKFKF